MKIGWIKLHRQEKDRILNALISLLYKNQGSAGVARNGHYGLSAEKFRLAVEHYLNTGIDTLEEHDFLVHSSWKMDRDWIIDLSDAKRLKRLLDGEGFWKPELVLREDIIQSLYGRIEYSERMHALDRSYEKRRKESLRYTGRKDVRQRIFQRDGNKCKKCSVVDRLTIDHIIPVRREGTDDDDNLQTLCHICNSSKSDS